MKNLVIILLFLIFSFSISGCGVSVFAPIVGAAGAVVDGVIAWKKGEAHKYYEFNSDIMHEATLRALEQLNLKITENYKIIPKKSRQGHTPRHYIVATSNNRFRINIYPIEENITKISIRINYMGDKPYAELIYTKIDDKVNTIEFIQ